MIPCFCSRRLWRLYEMTGDLKQAACEAHTRKSGARPASSEQVILGHAIGLGSERHDRGCSQSVRLATELAQATEPHVSSERSSVMHDAIQISAAVLVGLSASMGLAHVLELPGKLRLTEEQYRLVQPIYYPGFTIGGFVGEFGGILVTAALATITPFGTPAFWLTISAFVAFFAMHTIYWLMTHRVNKFWLAGHSVRGAGRAFFAFGSGSRQDRDWRNLRDQWEMSHVIRTALALVALSLLLTAMRS